MLTHIPEGFTEEIVCAFEYFYFITPGKHLENKVTAMETMWAFGNRYHHQVSKYSKDTFKTGLFFVHF